ncbi:MAG: hypothetical protein U5K00_16445 [Melioribacteraceae bacterium]|nr:hypothetical protein [Melioribacteraceae bacterium]
MKNYFYKCTACNKEYTSVEIEANQIYLCPNCGSCEKNQPLKGVLTVEYDYEHLKNIYTKDKFFSFIAGQIWSYPELWPIDFNKIDKNDLEKLSLTLQIKY